ncbi:hypothetical protein EON65_03540 [archaeon]|nr:MAG: hypothetical protein EON65_03540 [archaeon]
MNGIILLFQHFIMVVVVVIYAQPRRREAVAERKEPASHAIEILHPSSSSQGDLSIAGSKSNTDKVTHHGYHRFYPRFLEPYRTLGPEYGMLEIGIEKKKSLAMWREYFPHLFIYGLDINVQSKGDGFLIIQGDQSDLNSVRRIVQDNIKHTICYINDDGSHIPEHQSLCFDYLFDSLLIPGGTYIIEDIETSYWKSGRLHGYRTRYGLGHAKSIVEVFKLVVDYINREYLSEEDQRQITGKLNGLVSETTLSLISSVTFGQNCIIIVKKTAEEMQYSNRQYRFVMHLG